MTTDKANEMRHQERREPERVLGTRVSIRAKLNLKGVKIYTQ